MELLERASHQLWLANREKMSGPQLLPTANSIDPGDVDLCFAAVHAGLIDLRPDGVDRGPRLRPSGRGPV